jgi:peptide/nickel transport system permease protein
VIAAAAVLALLVLAGLLAPALAPYDPARQLDILALQNRPPSAAHPFGTDPYARDVLSRTLHAARTSLGVAALGAAVATVLGTAWGATAAAAGGRAERVLMRLVDVALGVPRVLVLLAVVALWGNVPPPALALLLGLSAWPGTSRLVRARVSQLRAAEFVTAARALGASPVRVLARPRAAAPRGHGRGGGTLLFAELLALEAGLSFLGSASAPPTRVGQPWCRTARRTCSTRGGTARSRRCAWIASVLAATTLGDRRGRPGAARRARVTGVPPP